MNQTILAIIIAAQLCAPYSLVLMVVAEAQAADVSPYLACAIANTENESWDTSAENHHALGTDHDLFQLCDRWFPISKDPRVNTQTALKHLRKLLDHYPEREAIARYSKGSKWATEGLLYTDRVMALELKLRGE